MSRFGNGSNSNGQFWYGSTTNFPGFLYKKNVGVGGRRSTKFAAGGNSTTNTNQYLYNKYKPGQGGIGASSIANRRAKNRLATICNKTGENNCYPCYKTLGQYNRFLYNPNGFYPCISNEINNKKHITVGLFTGDLEISNWSQFITSGGGSIDTSNAPTSITMVSGNSGEPVPDPYASIYITIPNPQVVTFTWNYSTIDSAFYDRFFYTLNNSDIQLSSNSGSLQNGTFSLILKTGDIFGFKINTVDGVAGPATTIISGTRQSII